MELTLAGAKIDSILRLTLREGTVYYFTHRSLTSPEPHYFIVVNADPLAQRVLLLAVVTSQVATVKLRRKSCPETLVELTPAAFDVLTKPSIVDCNDLKEVPLAEFNERFERKTIQYCDKRPASRFAQGAPQGYLFQRCALGRAKMPGGRALTGIAVEPLPRSVSVKSSIPVSRSLRPHVRPLADQRRERQRLDESTLSRGFARQLVVKLRSAYIHLSGP